jgi:sugar lactone lactonase YvrE
MKTWPLICSAALLACSGNNDTTNQKNPTEPSLSTVASLDASAYQLAEGLSYHAGKAYVGLAPTGTILAIDPSGAQSEYAHVPAGGNDGYTLGLVFGPQDELYVLETRNDTAPTAPVPGIYRIPPNGGSAMTPFATDPDFAFPNGAAFDSKGNLLVADSAAGRIFSVASDGSVETWKQDPELAGSTDCNAPLPFPIGANGIAVTSGAAYVANTSTGSISKIEIDADGNAGQLTTLVKDCQWVGFDGIALDDDGTILAAINGSPGELARVALDGTVTVLASSTPLDGPASVDIVSDWNGGRYALITNSAFFDTNAPTPGLLAYGPLP